MLPSPQTSPTAPRNVLEDRTNELYDDSPARPRAGPSTLPTPHDTPNRLGGKRKADENEGVNKRVRIARKRTEIYDTDTSDEDLEMEDVQTRMHVTSMQRCVSNVQGMLKGLAMGNPRMRRNFTLPTYPILKSFVSSNDLDVYKCQSMDQGSYLTPPYACAFSHDSKGGKSSILAVATEQGTIELINAAKRSEDCPGPARTTLQIHNNGVFDIKWSPTDDYLVSCSGDRTARIIDPRASVPEALHILQGHTSTVKCAAWNPTHRDLLATGGRDGCIHLWDLRVGPSKMEVEEAGVQREEGPSRLSPVVTIPHTHEAVPGKPTRVRRGVTTAAKSVTSIVFTGEYDVVSSGSNDGILRKWDLRYPPPLSTKKPKVKTKRNAGLLPIDEASIDHTTTTSLSLTNSLPRSRSSTFLAARTETTDVAAADTYSPRRARGISTLALGSGPSAGNLFALGIDSRVHVYNAYGAAGVPLGNEAEYEDEESTSRSDTYSHPSMVTNSFYVRIGVSPCGRWLASGSTGGSAFLFDISQSQSRPQHAPRWQGIQLPGQRGEVGALDWGYDTLATCADDGTVRVWRPDLDTVGRCWEGEAYAMSVARMSGLKMGGGTLGMGETRAKWRWADMDGTVGC